MMNRNRDDDDYVTPHCCCNCVIFSQFKQWIAYFWPLLYCICWWWWWWWCVIFIVKQKQSSISFSFDLIVCHITQSPQKHADDQVFLYTICYFKLAHSSLVLPTVAETQLQPTTTTTNTMAWSSSCSSLNCFLPSPFSRALAGVLRANTYFYILPP